MIRRYGTKGFSMQIWLFQRIQEITSRNSISIMVITIASSCMLHRKGFVSDETLLHHYLISSFDISTGLFQ